MVLDQPYDWAKQGQFAPTLETTDLPQKEQIREKARAEAISAALGFSPISQPLRSFPSC